MIYYNKHQTYLPPLIICLLLIAQANYLSGHRSRHTDIESSDDKKTNSDSFGTKTKGKHWTEKWETNHYKNGEKKKTRENVQKEPYLDEKIKWKINEDRNNNQNLRVSFIFPPFRNPPPFVAPLCF
ncbi:hypothetical protein Phum_PHUM490210 [Pediculus humanus corporis]|uniref:Uncharacterized protein n=1 Tax=Pediculus humanus subsp. corporis TaxID=121224 RepID=E0VWQ6_PEDHC|nr:uncharacterized protein Phum_PHUM490210 [Pediculus humanus corporis]EEB17812.1 hypothetical protein Phum_PHUM490210 [Pediculus humanus corporis]